MELHYFRPHDLLFLRVPDRFDAGGPWPAWLDANWLRDAPLVVRQRSGGSSAHGSEGSMVLAGAERVTGGSSQTPESSASTSCGVPGESCTGTSSSERVPPGETQARRERCERAWCAPTLLLIVLCGDSCGGAE